MQANASIKTSKLSPLADEKQRLFSVDNYLRVINDYSIEVSTRVAVQRRGARGTAQGRRDLGEWCTLQKKKVWV